MHKHLIAVNYRCWNLQERVTLFLFACIPYTTEYLQFHEMTLPSPLKSTAMLLRGEDSSVYAKWLHEHCTVQSKSAFDSDVTNV